MIMIQNGIVKMNKYSKGWRDNQPKKQETSWLELLAGAAILSLIAISLVIILL